MQQIFGFTKIKLFSKTQGVFKKKQKTSCTFNKKDYRMCVRVAPRNSPQHMRFIIFTFSNSKR